MLRDAPPTSQATVFNIGGLELMSSNVRAVEAPSGVISSSSVVEPPPATCDVPGDRKRWCPPSSHSLVHEPSDRLLLELILRERLQRRSSLQGDNYTPPIGHRAAALSRNLAWPATHSKSNVKASSLSPSMVR